MSHNPALCFRIAQRGFIRKGYYADLTLVDLNTNWNVQQHPVYSKCNWSIFDGYSFNSVVTDTFVNGNHVYKNGVFDESNYGMRILFNR